MQWLCLLDEMVSRRRISSWRPLPIRIRLIREKWQTTWRRCFWVNRCAGRKRERAIKLEASQLEPLVGRYEFVENPAIITTVTASGDRLFLQTADQPKLEVLPESETNFFLKAMPAIQVTFWQGYLRQGLPPGVASERGWPRSETA